MATDLLIGVIGSLVAAEVYMWLPALASWMVRLAASRLPRMSDRYREEWSAGLEEVPGHAAKFAYAVRLLVGLPWIARALPIADKKDVAAETPSDHSGDVVIGVPAGSVGITSAPVPTGIVAGVWISSGASVYAPSVSVSPSHPAYGSTLVQPILPLGGSTSATSGST